MELKEQNRIPEIESIRNKEIIFRWTREPGERDEASESESEGASRRERVATSSNGVSERTQGVTGERRIIRIGLWKPTERRDPVSLSLPWDRGSNSP